MLFCVVSNNIGTHQMERYVHISTGKASASVAITTLAVKFAEFKIGKSLVPTAKTCIQSSDIIMVDREVFTLLSVTDLHKLLDLNFREVLFMDSRLVVLSPITDIGSMAYRFSVESSSRSPNKDLLSLYKLLSLHTTELPE